MVKVSICVPAYKNPVGVERLLESIKVQSFTDYEVVVTDDSPDGSVEEVVRRAEVPGIVYVRNAVRKGATGNWNEAVRHASGEYIKIMHHDDWFTDRDCLARFVEMLEEHNQLRRPDRDPLEVNSIYVVDDAKQRKKMTAAFYRFVRREIAEYEERVTHLIQSGSQSPKIMDRWVMRIQGLEEKKRNYENILKRELTDLDEEFTSLRYLSDELRIRAAGLRVHQKAA